MATLSTITVFLAVNSSGDYVVSVDGPEYAVENLVDEYGHAEGARAVSIEITLALPVPDVLRVEAPGPEPAKASAEALQE